MKRLVCLLALWSLALAPLRAQEYLPEWQEGWMDIHHLAYSQGDCILLILPDGTSWVLDAGDTAWPHGDNIEWFPIQPDDSLPVGQRYVEYIRQFLKGVPDPGKIDYVSLSHFHGDHTGSISTRVEGKHGFGLSGMTWICDTWPVGTYIDRAYPSYDFPNKKACEHGFGGLFKDFQAMIAWQQATYGMKAEGFKVGRNDQFVLKHNPKAYKGLFEVRNLCGQGLCWTGKGNGTRKMYHFEDVSLIDENMQSCGVKVRYGDFSYYNSGDLSAANYGIYRCQERFFEEYVAEVCGKITLFKPDHHGWRDGTCAKLLMATRPDVFIFPSSNKDHPYIKTFERIDDPLVYRGEREYYITSEAVKQTIGADNWAKFKPFGHVVCRVYEGGKSYRMYVLDVFSGDYRIKYQSDLKTPTK